MEGEEEQEKGFRKKNTHTWSREGLGFHWRRRPGGRARRSSVESS